MRVSAFITAAFAAAALTAQPAGAQETYVNNSDFEAGWYAAEGEYLPTHIYGTPGWNWSGGSGTGRWNPASSQMTDAAAHGVVGYATGAIAAQQGPAHLAQAVPGLVIEANTLYTLTLDVGQALNETDWGYNFGLIAGSTDPALGGFILTSLSGSTGEAEFDLVAGQFTTLSLTFQTSDAGAEIGKSLIIALGGLGRGAAYDNVRLSSSSITAPAVPEPSTWAMMLFGFGAAGVAMRRQRKATAQPA